jgi:hypothetical protein
VDFFGHKVVKEVDPSLLDADDPMMKVMEKQKSEITNILKLIFMMFHS